VSQKLWGGRFTQDTSRIVEDFTASIHFDKRLYKQDIQGSMVHARMLGKCGIITEAEAEQIIRGLEEIQVEIEQGKFTFLTELEDIHMAIERRLIEKIGEVGGKLHTARSRNDQVALDLRLYLREEIWQLIELIKQTQLSLLTLAENHLEVILPGYTHLQRAQPILFAHHVMAYFEMLERDKERFQDCQRRINVLPLGSAALAGTSFPIDREFVARELGFQEISRNSIDAVSDRDFVIETASVASLLMMHLSRLCEELVLWSSAEFGFIELSDAFCTGSSIMPQKKNPDVPELIRGKTGRVYGALISLLTTMKSLPLAYNRDMQEDKEPIFEVIDTLKASLQILSKLLLEIKVNPSRTFQAANDGFSTATDVADYLVRKGIPFRIAHEVTGNLIRYCIEQGKKLLDLNLEEFHKFSRDFDSDILQVIQVSESVNSRKIYGGTARECVIKAINEAKKRLENKGIQTYRE
jgi:argininosuccinate lyase